jgi:inosine-uridine nucleoside N-ribohydrolase
MKSRYQFDVSEFKKIRVIIDTDAKNEADDQFAIVHALLSKKLIIKGIIAAHFGTRRTNASMNESYDEIRKVLALMKAGGDIEVAHGSPSAIAKTVHGKTASTGLPMPSCEGSDLIIKEALADDPRPLFCIFLGPLTDMAVALLKRPEIDNRLTVIWIGGGQWPEGGEEFNLSNDIEAANVVYRSKAEMWQVSRNIYSKLKVSLAELQDKVKPCGKIGSYLFRQMVDFNDSMGNNPGWPMGESWVLGDSAAVGLLLDDHAFSFKMVPAPEVGEGMKYFHERANRPIRMYDDIDSRFILEDFFSKIRINYR